MWEGILAFKIDTVIQRAQKSRSCINNGLVSSRHICHIAQAFYYRLLLQRETFSQQRLQRKRKHSNTVLGFCKHCCCYYFQVLWLKLKRTWPRPTGKNSNTPTTGTFKHFWNSFLCEIPEAAKAGTGNGGSVAALRQLIIAVHEWKLISFFRARRYAYAVRSKLKTFRLRD